MKSEQFLECRLLHILEEMESQSYLKDSYPPEQLSFGDSMALIRNFVCEGREYGLAYESIIANLENLPFKLSGKNSVRLLELGLVMKYKTERTEDDFLDGR